MSASEKKHVEEPVADSVVQAPKFQEKESFESMVVESVPNNTDNETILEEDIKKEIESYTSEATLQQNEIEIQNDSDKKSSTKKRVAIREYYDGYEFLRANHIIIEEDESAPDPHGFLTDSYGMFCGPQCKEVKEELKWFGPYSLDCLFTDHKNTSLRTAISFLLGFVQENFTGPTREEGYENVIEKIPSNLIKVSLRTDGEDINVNVRYLELFHCSKILFDNLSSNYPECMTTKWWEMRSILIHQKILDNVTMSLYKEFKKVANVLLSERSFFNNKELEMLLCLEISQGYLLFNRVQKCDEILQNICENYKIDLVIEGVLGLRTRFQQKPLPILCLRVDGAENLEINVDETLSSTIDLPVLLKHEDDTRLEKIKFINEKDNDVMRMLNTVQAFVFTKLRYILKSQPKDRLASEEVEPYINSLLYQENGPLSIRISTLLLNVEQECKGKRTVERSLKQLEEINSILKSKEKFILQQRLQNFFSSNLPPFWEIKKQYGDVMVSLGLVKSALDVYIEIQAWEDVIDCYNKLELKHKAAEIIQQEIEKHPTVKLYCLLGDATDDPGCYEIAWELSARTSSLAQRCWGNYYFFKKDYEAALPHLEKTVNLNPLQEVQWLRLGYAAIALENWDVAVTAYITYTHLEPNSFESWNNLATALIKLGNKERAHKILQESIRCNYDNWKIWENFLAVSCDTGNYEDVVRSYQRLNELKDNFLDLSVLRILVKAALKDKSNAKGNFASGLKKTVVGIIGHQCVKYPTNWKLFKLAAKLDDNSLHQAQKLQKCFRVYIENEKNWTLKKDTTKEGLKICLKLCETSLEAIKDHSEDEKSSVNSQLSSARLSAQSCLTLIEKSDEKFEEFAERIKKIQELHGKLTEELKQRVETSGT